MKSRIPFDRVNWATSGFLMATALASVTAVPIYLWNYGLDLFQAGLFLFFFGASGLSITLGYHRLFSHLSFKASWPVRAFTLVFGASAFENSALWWCSEHRRHHKFVDHDDDPYDITKGFFHAHIGWLLFKLRPETPLDNVNDLQRDPLVRLQHRFIHPLAFLVGFGLPAAIGFLYGGSQAALGAFLLAGVFRIFCVQHATFFINSLCHMVGRQPYSSSCTARDSWVMALFTFGEGYHNFHHEFQHDYRNGVKPWQWDPTKWSVWILSKLGLVRALRRVPEEKILLSELREAQRQIANLPEAEELAAAPRCWAHSFETLQDSLDYLQEFSGNLAGRCTELKDAAKQKIALSKEVISEWRTEIRLAMDHLQILREAGFSAAPA